MKFTDPEYINPIVHCFARCHICRKLIPIKRSDDGELILTERKCPSCGVFLDDHEVFRSFAANLAHTAAITAANKLISLDPAVIPYLISQLLITYFQFPVWARSINLLIYHLPLFLIGRWLYRYWHRLRFTDAEYLEAVRGIRQSFALWSAVNFLNWVLLLV